ncbi:MAG: GntR family transcriptional regulator [Variibacter sp.]
MDQIADFNVLKVVRSSGTLREQVVAKLRKAIIAGTFAPGERLVERRLVELLGVSRTLVREALRQLETEGLIETLPYKGPAVTALTAEQVRQIYEMRAAMEGLAAKLFAERASEDDIDRLDATVKAIARCYRLGDGDGQRAAVENFYEILLAGTGNAILMGFVGAQRARLAWLRAVSLARKGRSRTSIEEKRAIVAAIKARNTVHARALTEAHIAAAFDSVSRVLTDVRNARPRERAGRKRP